MRGGYVNGDPRWIRVRYQTRCKCGAPVPAGAQGFYWPRTRSVECVECGNVSEARFLAEVQDEVMSGGWG